MKHELEISTLDLRYEPYRMKNGAQEAKLLSSIMQKGIEEPLEGVDLNESHILLNGFKRYRCARKLHLETAPYLSIAEDEVMGIIALLKISNTKSLGLLEQARFVDDLKHVHKMSVAEIAQHVGKSKAWVSVRLGLISELTDKIRDKIFRGDFPVYSFMYTVRPFMRINKVSPQEVEDFVLAVSGKKVSVRDIEQLAHGFFRGPLALREQILSGNLALPLEHMREISEAKEGMSEFERVLVKDLEITQKYMQRVMGKSHDPKLSSQAFYAEVNLLTAGILSRARSFYQTMRELHDRSGHA